MRHGVIWYYIMWCGMMFDIVLILRDVIWCGMMFDIVMM